jgi:flagellar biosynthesis/type III secretory pathway protein FliH
MKSIYPLVVLLSAVIVTAGPVPRFQNLSTRTNDLVHPPNQARTEPIAAPAPVPSPEPVSAPPPALAQADAEHKKAADLMEAEHVAKAEAEAKASQEGKKHFYQRGSILANTFQQRRRPKKNILLD